MKYTTVGKVSNYILEEIAVDYQPVIDEYIEAVSLEMDQLANRKLVAEEDDTVKFYDGNGLTKISLDDLQVIDTLEIGDVYGENFVENTNYITYPTVVPFRGLILKSGIFNDGVQNIKVTGSWGLFATAPKDIEFACTVLVAGIINNQTNKGQVTSERIGNYAVSFDTEIEKQDYVRALQIINSYRKQTF